MARYFYTAKSFQGENQSGFLEAKDIQHLAQILRSQGFVLIKAELEKEGKKKKFSLSLPSFGVSLAEKMFFTRNLQLMISAGLPLPRALLILSEQTKSKKFKKVLSEVREEIVKGESFSQSLSHYPQVFSELYQNMVSVGEESGGLEGVLGTLSLQMERENGLKSKVKSAMIYPAVIITAMIGIGVLMLVTVIPKLADTFKELNMQLPLTTRLVIGLANFLITKWYLLIIIIAALVFILLQALKTSLGKKIIDKLTLKIPVLSQIIKNTNSAYTARTLSSLISAGVSLPRALEITSRTLGNIFYQMALMESVEKVKKGKKLSEALIPYENIYPPTLIHMISVGEETGETSGILSKLADFYEEEVSNAAKNLTSVIEPVLMIIIGAVIGFFAVSMVQPLYSMLEGI